MMAIIQFEYFCIINVVLIVLMAAQLRADDERGFSQHQVITKKNKCLNPPRTARRVETVIPQCQEEVKNKLLNEALEILKVQVSETIQHFEEPKVNHSAAELQEHNATKAAGSKNGGYIPFDEVPQSIRRMKRYAHDIRRIDQLATGIYHPTLVPMEDKRIAGCLLHCVYAKNNAINKNGWPTLDGLVHFYSEGVNEHGFFMATLRSVNLCLRAVTHKYHVNRFRLPQKGESCDLAFDVFDCISDQITGYCLDQYRN